VVGLLIKVYCWVCQWIFKKSANRPIWQIYKQERGCLVHFLAVCWSGAHSARDNHVLASNFAKYSPILFFFTGKLNNKPFSIWLLTTPRHLKYVATLRCNLLLIACFLTFAFHRVVWQHAHMYVGFLINDLLQIYKGIFQWKKIENWLRFPKIVLMSLWPHIFGPPCIYCRLVHTRFIWFLYVLSQSTLPGRDRQTGRRAVYNGAVDWESGIKTFGNCKW